MANCKVQYNSDNTIARVLDENGKESSLFKQIARLPHVESLEEALDIYKNKYAGGIMDSEIIQPTDRFEQEMPTEILDELLAYRAKIKDAPTAKIKEKRKAELNYYLETYQGAVFAALESRGLLYKTDC